MSDSILDHSKEKMNKTVAALEKEFASIRAGRANPAVLDKVVFNYYGTPTPIAQVAAVSVPEPRTLAIQPWDSSILRDVERAILSSDLGITPSNDGRVIRLNFPQLNEERRRELVKEIHKFGEEAKIAVRNIRRDSIEKYKQEKKNGNMTEDDLKDAEKKEQELTDKFCKEIDELVSKKQKDILEI